MKTAILLAFVLASVPALAAPIFWNEIVDAGDSVALAQYTIGLPSDSLLAITGSLSSGNDVDMYWITIPVPSLFSANTLGTAFDTQLFMFTPSGMGVLANDDHTSSTTGYWSLIPPGQTFSAGRYLLAISRWDRDPVSALGLIFPTSPWRAVHGPTGPGGGLPLSSWSGSTNDAGAYQINLSGAAPAVPEPVTLSLIGAGLLAFGLLRRRKK